VTTFFISLLFISLFMLALGLGVMLGREPIRGSCGGVNNPEGCEVCAGSCPKRKRLERQARVDSQRES
jgi:hypothetical protein